MNQTPSSSAIQQNPHLSQIDKVLKGVPDDVKVKVYEVVQELGLDSDDPIFLFSIILGHMRIIVDSEPIQIKQLFDTFNQEIEKWANQNVQTLQKIAEKAELSERIAQNTETLSSLLKELLTASTTLIDHLQKSSVNSLNSISQLRTSVINLENLIQKSLQENQALSRSNQEIVARLGMNVALRNNPRQNNKGKNPKWIAKLILFLLVLNSVAFSMAFPLLNSTRREVQWLLQKANRRECLAGIKSKDSPECAGIL